jgi:hypothetical protein
LSVIFPNRGTTAPSKTCRYIEEMRRLSKNPESLGVYHPSERGYAFPLRWCLEIMPFAQLIIPPGLPPVLRGFLDRGRSATPIVLLDHLLDLHEQLRELNRPFIILNGIDSPVAFLSGVIGQIRLPHSPKGNRWSPEGLAVDLAKATPGPAPIARMRAATVSGCRPAQNCF